MATDAKFFARGKIEELRAELQTPTSKDKGLAKRKAVLKRAQSLRGCG